LFTEVLASARATLPDAAHGERAAWVSSALALWREPGIADDPTRDDIAFVEWLLDRRDPVVDLVLAVIGSLELGAATQLAAAAVEIVAGDALAYLARAGERFNVVFLDPPFRQNALPALLAALPPRLQHGARVYVEGDRPAEAAVPWRELKRARAGQVSYQLLQWSEHDPSRVPGDV